MKPNYDATNVILDHFGSPIIYTTSESLKKYKLFELFFNSLAIQVPPRVARGIFSPLILRFSQEMHTLFTSKKIKFW